MTYKNGRNLRTKWASKTHFVRLSLQFCGDRSVLRMQAHGRNWAYSFVPPLVYITEWSGQESNWKVTVLHRRSTEPG